MFDSKILTTILVFLVVILFIVTLIFGEDVKLETNTEEYPEDRFVKILDYGDNFVMYDKETKVQYFASTTGITVLLNQDGKPLLYEGE